MKFVSSTIAEFNFQKVHSKQITQIVPCLLLPLRFLCFYLRVNKSCYIFSPNKRLLRSWNSVLYNTYGKEGNRGFSSECFFQIVLSVSNVIFSAWKKHISPIFQLLVLIPCKNTARLFCKSFLPSSAAAASWKQWIIVKVVCAFSSTFTHKFHIPSFCLGPAICSPMEPTLPIPDISFVCCIYSGNSSSLDLSASHNLSLLILSQFQSHLIWVH